MELNVLKLESQLILEEGLRLMAYDDATGYPVPPGGVCKGNLTVGVGHNLDACPLTAAQVEEVGHDGRSQPITHDNAIMILRDDIEIVCTALDQNLAWWEELDEIRARVMADLTFNMGMGRLKQFHDFLDFMRAGRFSLAAGDLQGTPWYKQTGTRGVRLVNMIRSGEDYTS